MTQWIVILMIGIKKINLILSATTRPVFKIGLVVLAG
jgi:hypothetical protein